MSETNSQPMRGAKGGEQVTHRRAFLDARRRSSRERYDAIHSAAYDRDWGAISATHARCLERLLEHTRSGGTILDAACGTGKYWGHILGSGRTVIGMDQSRGMLEVARGRYPHVPSGLVALQDLAFDELFDAVICIDALENIGPEDWPTVVGTVVAALRPGAPTYLTVEQADEREVERAFEQARAMGHPVVPGEDFDGVGYHYYPPRTAVLAWLEEAGLDVIDEAEGDGYWHIIALDSDT